MAFSSVIVFIVNVQYLEVKLRRSERK